MLRRLGYEARYKVVPPKAPYWQANRQVGVSGWAVDYPSTNNVFEPQLTCRAYTPDPTSNTNYAGFCDPHLDREIARAHDLQTTDPAAATRLWRAVDREVTDQAPWIPMRTDLSPDVVSRRTGNYIAASHRGSPPPVSTSSGCASVERSLRRRARLQRRLAARVGGVAGPPESPSKEGLAIPRSQVRSLLTRSAFG